MNYTIGGIVSKDAEDWSAENNQRFGDIIYKLHSGNVDTMARAYIGFYAMMRQFMREDWERKISALDAWRKKHNLRSIGSLLNKTRELIITMKHQTAEREELLREVMQAQEVSEFEDYREVVYEPEHPVIYAEPKREAKANASSGKQLVEQLSLF
jgi:hypothetical protein